MQRFNVPIVRSAKRSDSEAIVDLIFNGTENIYQRIFTQPSTKVKSLLKRFFEENISDIIVITEGMNIIGASKIRSDRKRSYSGISYLKLIKSLGLFSGLKAGILLSTWDEYKPRLSEAYLEFLVVDKDFDFEDVTQVFFSKLKNWMDSDKIRYLSLYVPKLEKDLQENILSVGFEYHKSVSSPLAYLFRRNHKWYRYIYLVSYKPVTVKGKIKYSIMNLKETWNENRVEFINSIKLSIPLLLVPIVAGFLAYYRGYTNAAYAWGIVLSIHMFGLIILLRGIEFGRFFLSFAVSLETGNLILRSLLTTDWFDKTWLLTLSTINLYIILTLLFVSSISYKVNAKPVFIVNKPFD